MGRKCSFCSIGNDKGQLRIKIYKKISQPIFGIDNKILYLGLTDTTENRSKAEEIQIQIENDIRANKLNKDLSLYLPSKNLVEQVGIAYDPNRADISFQELYSLYEVFKKTKVAETTFRDRFKKNFRRVVNRCSKDLNNQPEIVDSIYENTNGEYFHRTCSLVSTMIDWGKRQNYIPEDFQDKINRIKQDYTVKNAKVEVPKEISELEGYYHDHSYKGFTREEARKIIEGFEDVANLKYFIDYKGNKTRYAPSRAYNNLIYSQFVKLKFWTGCRGCEASGLLWSSVSKDFEYIVFKYAYDYDGKKNKSLKREKKGQEGNFSRRFPCSEKLKVLLEKLYKQKQENSFKNNDYIFVNSFGNVIGSRAGMRDRWVGKKTPYRIINEEKVKLFVPGVIYKLVKEKKIKQYLTPYATRHTWINLQLQAGVPIANVAKYAGNSPKTIVENYVSFIPNIPLAPEI